MKKILNIHCHPQVGKELKDNTIYSYLFPKLPPLGVNSCSSGIHPWFVPAKNNLDWDLFTSLVQRPEVRLIGECGLDTFADLDMQRQLEIFRKQIEISEEVQKPLLIHMVRTTTEIMALRQEYRPSQTWIIHGFRGKPQLAQQYFEHGLLLSIGPKFNLQTVKSIPLNKLLVETSDSGLSVEEVIASIAQVKNLTTQQLIDQIYSNTDSLLFG